MLKSFSFRLKYAPRSSRKASIAISPCHRPSRRQKSFYPARPQTPSGDGRCQLRAKRAIRQRFDHASFDAEGIFAHVKISGSPSVIRTVCSKWADSEPSCVTTVQPSFRIFTSGPARVHHRLNRNRHARLQLRRVLLALVKIRHLRLFVHRPPDPVADKFAHHAETVLLNVLLNRDRNIQNPVARLRLRDAQIKRLLRHVQQPLRRDAATAHRHRPRRITDKTFVASRRHPR